MKATPNLQVEKFRVRQGPMASRTSFGNNGAFLVPGPHRVVLMVIASDGMGWEHVSVSTKHRPPLWDEMCFVKDLFWEEEEWVIQYHPAKSAYVNNCRHALHLWRPIGFAIPAPPVEMVGDPALTHEDLDVMRQMLSRRT